MYVCIIREAGFPVQIEPRGLLRNSEDRPDLLVQGGGGAQKDLVLDVVVSDPTAPAHSQHAARRAGHAAKRAAELKNGKWLQRCEYLEKDFKPFSVESYGFLHPDAAAYIQRLGTRIPLQPFWSLPSGPAPAPEHRAMES